MSLTDGEQAVLDATAHDLLTTAPALAGFLADGPALLRLRGVDPDAIDDLVPGWEPPRWSTRLRRRLRPGAFRVMRPPEPYAR